MFCQNCGKELKEGSKFCIYCGTPIANAEAASGESRPNGIVEKASTGAVNNSQQDNSNPTAPKKSNKGLIIGVVAAVLVAVIIGVVFLVKGGLGGSGSIYGTYEYSLFDAVPIGTITLNKDKSFSWAELGNGTFELDDDEIIFTVAGSSSEYEYYLNGGWLLLFDDSDEIGMAFYRIDDDGNKDTQNTKGDKVFEGKYIAEGGLVLDFSKDGTYTDEDGNTYHYFTDGDKLLGIGFGMAVRSEYELNGDCFTIYDLYGDSYTEYWKNGIIGAADNIDIGETVIEDTSEEVATSENSFADILNQNKDAILAFGDWQRNRSMTSGQNRPVAFYDLNGDGNEELIFGYDKGYSSHVLKICTEGAICDLYDDLGVQFVPAGADVSGSFLMIASKNAGEFYTIDYGADAYESAYTLYKYSIDSVGNVSLIADVVNSIHYDENFNCISDVYYVNGNEVSTVEGGSYFKELKQNFKNCIMYDGFIEDLSVQELFSESDVVAMSFEQALNYIK